MGKTNYSRCIEESCLMDDLFFELFFKKDPKYIEVVIREIFKQLNKPLVKIISVSTQHNLKTFGGCDPRLDLLAEDEKGRINNIEVQRSVSSSHPKRGRYYSASIDTNTLPKGASYNDLPETYVIFIMEKDFRKKGRPAYVVDRYYDDGERYNDEATIIYVNGEYRGDDPIGRLMSDFNAVRADTMNNKELAERMTFLKDTESGRREFSGLREEIFGEGVEKGREEGREEGQENIILSMLRKGLSSQFIATNCDFPEQRVKELRDRLVEKGLLPA